MPKIKDVKPFISKIAHDISKINGVKSVLMWGSYALNINNPNFIIRDIDIIAINKFNSGDLLSISDGKNSPLKISSSTLVEEGFNPEAINFTKNFIKINTYNLDHWAISSDNHLLHWGPIVENKKDWDDLKKEAEQYTEHTTKIKRSLLKTSSEKITWRKIHDHYLNNFLSDMPNGWYQSEHNVKDIINETKRII
jgi:hypothetical protein